VEKGAIRKKKAKMGAGVGLGKRRNGALKMELRVPNTKGGSLRKRKMNATIKIGEVRLVGERAAVF